MASIVGSLMARLMAGAGESSLISRSRLSYEPVNQTRSHYDARLKELGAYRLQMTSESWNKAMGKAFNVLGKDLYENQAEWIAANKSTPNTVSQYAIWP